VNGVGVVGAGGGEDLVDAEVVIQMGGLVCLADVEGGAVNVGINGNGGDAHFAQSADDAESDFAAVGNEDFSEHPS
jgi:hypothetical protein